MGSLHEDPSAVKVCLSGSDAVRIHRTVEKVLMYVRYDEAVTGRDVDNLRDLLAELRNAMTAADVEFDVTHLVHL